MKTSTNDIRRNLYRVITEAQHRLDDPFLNAQEAAELQNRIRLAAERLTQLEDTP